jgi:hypothetical protein
MPEGSQTYALLSVITLYFSCAIDNHTMNLSATRAILSAWAMIANYIIYVLSEK